MTSDPPQFITLGQLVESLVTAIPGEQRELDKGFQDRWEAFGPILQRLNDSGYKSLAREIVPTPVLISETEIETDFHFVQQQEREAGLGVRLLNLGYLRRFEHEQFVESCLKVKVRRVPYPPAESEQIRENAE